MFKLLLAVASLLPWPLAAAPAAIQEDEDACLDDQARDRCAQEQQRRMRALYGVRPVEEHRDAGDQVRRIFYVDGYGRDTALIAFIRSPERDPMVWVHFPRPGGEPAPEPLSTLIPAAIWSEALLRSEHFDRELVPLSPDPREQSICMHAWFYLIEATDPARGEHHSATLRRETEDACEDGLAGMYASELQRLTLPLFPHCNALDPLQHRNPVSMLVACRLLRGDRLAAAEVLNLAGAFRRASTRDEAALIYGRFDHRAAIDWNGDRNQGDGSAVAFWIDRMFAEGRPSFFVEAVHGEGAHRVRLAAILSRSVQGADGADSHYEHAEVEQIWARHSGEMRIERATVGPWVRSPE